MGFDEPSEANGFCIDHVVKVLRSFRRWTGKDLVGPAFAGVEAARTVFEAPFALVSHGAEADPIFNYGNRATLRLFERTWGEFTAMPSRLSAEPLLRDERQRLMEEVAANGYVADFPAVRVSKSGRRFSIKGPILWNVLDDEGILRGQAALFTDWRFLDGVPEQRSQP